MIKKGEQPNPLTIRFNGIDQLSEPQSITVESGDCVDLINCDVDNDGNVTRRSGFSSVYPAQIDCLWGNNEVSYCRMDSHISVFDGTDVTIADNTFEVTEDCEFKEVNDVVMFSDGTTIGVVSGGTESFLYPDGGYYDHLYLPPIPGGRTGFCSVLCYDHLFVIGGTPAVGEVVDGMVIPDGAVYRLIMNDPDPTWERVAELPTPIRGASASFYNGNLFVYGGEYFVGVSEEYSPTGFDINLACFGTNYLNLDWIITWPNDLPFSHVNGTAIQRSQVTYLVGGNINLQMISRTSTTWYTNYLDENGVALNATTVINGAKIYSLGGGGSETAPSGVVRVFDLYQQALGWDTTTYPAYPLDLNGMFSFFLGNKLYAGGGVTGTLADGETTDVVMVLDLDAAVPAWVAVSSLPYGIAYANSCVYEGRAYIYGGITADVPQQTVYRYRLNENAEDVVYLQTIAGLVPDNFPATVTPGTVIYNNTDWVDVTQVAQWVTNNAPAGLTADASNFEVDTFKLSTLSGICLEFFNGALFLAIDNFVFVTKAFDAGHMDIRYNVVAGFQHDVTMIKRVRSGLFIGTTGGDYYLDGTQVSVNENGTLEGGFTQKKINTYGAIKGSDVTIPGTALASLEISGDCAMWTTRQGIMLGSDGGNVKNVSENVTLFPASTKVAATFREFGADKIKQYIVCFDSTSSAFTPTDEISDTLVGTWVVNLTNLKHSRYERYPFNSFARLNDVYYGANHLGLYELSGDLDGEAQIESTIDSLATDFGEITYKNVPDLWINCSTEADLSVDTMVDGELVSEENLMPYDDRAGVHRRRVKLPLGSKGSFWRFIIRNTSGCQFLVKSIEAFYNKSKNRY